MLDKILILDFGSQFTQLIARRIRELNVFAEIHPYDVTLEFIKNFDPKGIIFSGGPNSTYEALDLAPTNKIYDMQIPILGICYGMQIMASQLGGIVEKSPNREFGNMQLHNCKSQLLENISDGTLHNGNNFMQVWMSHGDKVTKMPNDFEVIAVTSNCPIAGMANIKKNFFGVQFHPEVTHTKQGLEVYRRFIIDICKCNPTWTMPNFSKLAIKKIQETVQNDKIILALSGGVDSSVVALLIDKAIHQNLICIFVDTGLLRKNEAQDVMQTYQNNFGLNIIKIDAKDEFYNALKGVIDPEEKRKIIGELFIRIFEKEANKLKDVKWLAQGTIYPDIIESAGLNNKAHSIKSHHNVGGLPEKLSLKLIEPIRELFKDEVRSLGIELGLNPQIINRHPFPGPGLAIRIIGEVTQQFISLLQEADAIFLDELHKHNYYKKIAQAFAVFIPIKSVGVMGDHRTYEYLISLRAVETTDFMTANVANLPLEFITSVANKIINNVQGINRVVYDVSSKPPATIEWE